jgi:hypothetical protein
MMTMSLVTMPVATTHEFAPSPIVLDRAVVRVIWGRALGSTYQKTVNGKVSFFSMPLSCPECRWAFDLTQPEGNPADQLVGTCRSCQTSATFNVEVQGRLSKVEALV